MPNVNFTSSSIAQQDRFAQTTVSYESRNMQSIPFYPDVDHKAKFRGIFALTLICSIVVGAIFGLLFGFRDVLFRAVESVPAVAAWLDDDGAETSSVPADEVEAEGIDFSLAANSEVDPWDYISNSFEQTNYTVYYNGKNVVIPEWDSEVLYTQPGVTKEYEYVFKIGGSLNSAKPINNTSDWPVDAGTYTIWIYVKDVNTGKEYKNPIAEGKRVIYIKKADIVNFPGIDAKDSIYSGSEVSLKVKDDSELKKYGVEGTVEFQIKHQAYGKSTYSTVSKVCDAGKYKVTLVVNGNKNVNKKTFDVDVCEFEIFKATAPWQDIDKSQVAITDIKDSVYRPNEAKKVEVIEDKLVGLVKEIYQDAVKKNLITGFVYSSVNAVIKDNLAVNVGDYSAKLTITHPNYNDIVLEKRFTITPADLRDYFTFKDSSAKYNGIALTEQSPILNISKDAAFPKYITVTYDYEMVKNSDVETGLTPGNIVKIGTYRIIAHFSYNDIDAPKNFILPEDGSIVRNLTITKGDIVLSNVSIKTLTATYTGGRITLPKDHVTVTGIPASENLTINLSKAYAIDAGTHEVTVTISGANYNTTTATATIVIEKAPFGGSLGLKYDEKQTVKKTGKMMLPTHSKLPDGVEYDYLIGGKSIKEQGGIDTLGTHRIDLVVSDKNHEEKFSFDFTIKFNPMSIVFGLVLGVIAGILLSILIWLGYRNLEEASYKSFRGVRLRLQHERGGDRGAIVCEGRVTIINWNSEQEHRDFPWIVEPRFGRLFLTHSTLEYYDSSCSGGNIKTYKNYRNFLIQLKDVTGVEIRGVFFRAKLIVFARGGRHVFYVEPNTAYLWRRDIMHFRDLAHLYPMENNVVDNNYPFNYRVLDPKGKDPNVPKNV